MPSPSEHRTFLEGEPGTLDLLRRFEHYEPHAILGAHPAVYQGRAGIILRAFHPDAVAAECQVVARGSIRMEPLGGGVFATFIEDASHPLDYRLTYQFASGALWEREDPYRFLPTLGETDLYLFNEGTHRRLWEVLGAHPRRIDGVEGTAFAVWAPNALRVSVIGDFNNWDGRLMPMRSLGNSGVFELFVPGVRPGALYKYEVKTKSGDLRIKTDPFAFQMEVPPGTAAIVNQSSYQWGDEAWMRQREATDITRSPVSIYEVHLGSWMRVPGEGFRWLKYREIAPRLVEHVKALGFTHIELLPLAEHAFYPSWGYQVTGYYAPTSRYGSPDDLRYFVDYCHRHGVGVILDWVPAHFPRDDFSLRRFDGTALYEHEDPRLGEHPDWGTLIFNYGRSEVKNFLVANALYWLQEFHLDSLRVDAVASILYLDYSRKAGQWVPNSYGGRENLDAIDFVRDFNTAIRAEVPGAFTVAEESTAWGGVTRPPEDGGLGFTFKWNMGWMHDTLLFFQKDPIHRRYHQNDLTFAMLYEFTERFINAISHDEVVHGKGAILDKLPGDLWQKLANLRLLLTYQVTRPGKQLVFMGTELGQWREWNHDESLDWHLAQEPERKGLAHFIGSLNRLYAETPAFWQADPQPESFEWVDCSDADNSILSFVRRAGKRYVVVVLNLTPVPRESYRIGAPEAVTYLERLSSDAEEFGGSGYRTRREITAEPIPMHGRSHSLELSLPPLGALVLEPIGSGS